MISKKPPLKEILETAEGKKLLFLGKEGIFTEKEIMRYLKRAKITACKYLEDGVVAVIEHPHLNPVEEDISNDAYDLKLPLFKLSEFEQLLSEEINEDELLMGIKLSNDQERIFRLLGNENISHTLFVKLLKLYEWHNDEEDNREDRDVIMHTLRRYIDIKPNEQDLLYSYLTLRRLASEATDPDLLLALIGFPNFEFLVRGKEKVTLRETIARNPYIDREVIQKLLSFRDEKINASLCANPATPLETLKFFLTSDVPRILRYLANNRNIDDEIFFKLLDQEESVVSELLHRQHINRLRFDAIQKKMLPETLFALLGTNRELSEEVISVLLQSKNSGLLAYLSANETLSTIVLEDLYEKGIAESDVALAANPSLPVPLLESLYTRGDKEIDIALASNPSTPETILRELFEREMLEINKGLASNPSLPMELLDSLKIDTRLQNALAENPIFIEEYAQTLDYDKEAVQF